MTKLEPKIAIRKLINQFELSDNLFDLVKAMKIGVSILEENEFPMNEFAIYKYRHKRYGKEKRINRNR